MTPVNFSRKVKIENLFTPKKMTYTIDKIISVLKAKGYPVAEDDTKNYNLNLVGIRSLNNSVNSFDDLMTVFWRYQNAWTIRIFPCTTDPGLTGLLIPQNPKGTAIVKEGHYKDVWKIGMHQGKYKALTQQNPITVIRDFDKDKELDFNSGKEETGVFGINCHRANSNGQSVQIDLWSLGCQVLQNRQINNPDNQIVKVFEFDYFMHLCDKKVENGNGSGFNYSLITSKDFS